MKLPPTALGFLLAIAWIGPAGIGAAQGGPAPRLAPIFGGAEVERAAQAAFLLAKQVWFKQLAGKVPVQTSDRRSLAEAIERDALPRCRAEKAGQVPPEDEARRIGAALSSILPVYFSPGGFRVLVCPDNFSWLARLPGDEPSSPEEILKMLLAFALAEAADEIEYCFGVRAQWLRTGAEHRVLESLRVGHARYLLGKIAARAEWGDPGRFFAFFLERPPADAGQDPPARILARESDRLARIHRDGLRFISALVEACGNTTAEALLMNPPKPLAGLLEADPALLGEEADKKTPDPAAGPGWALRIFSLGVEPEARARALRHTDLAWRLEGLPGSESAALAGAVAVHRGIRLTPENGFFPECGATVTVFSDAGGATGYFNACKRLRRMEEAHFARLRLRQKDRRKTDLSGEGVRGIVTQTQMVAGDQKYPCSDLYAVRDRLVIEIWYRGLEREEAAMTLLFRHMSQAVSKGGPQEGPSPLGHHFDEIRKCCDIDFSALAGPGIMHVESVARLYLSRFELHGKEEYYVLDRSNFDPAAGSWSLRFELAGTKGPGSSFSLTIDLEKQLIILMGGC